MSLRLRIALGIFALVVLSILLVWVASARGVLRPFAAQVFDAYLDQAVFVAERVEAGDDPAALGRRLGLVVTVFQGERLPGARGRAGLRRRGEGEPPPPLRLVRNGREVVARPGARNHVFVRVADGWVGVRRDLDPDRPARLLPWWLLAVGGVVLVVAVTLASAATRPLTTAREGMERIARGDLAHRLHERGPDEIARVARAFNRMADRIVALLRTERELMAGMSHELRTPLARLGLELELLEEDGASPRRIAAMRGDLGELDALIGQLLQLSRLQLGERALALAPTSWAEIVDRALETVALDDHPLTREGTGGAFDGDAELLVRVVVNLLRNAVRYTPSGTPIRIHADGAVLVVADDGPGVPEAQLVRLFDPFWRGEGSRARETGGLGLGLMLVRQVVELHGGRVSAANRVGGGLAVTVDLSGRAGG